MGGPWEKYQTPSSAAPAKPWEKYQPEEEGLLSKAVGTLKTVADGVQKYADSPFTGAIANAVEGKNPIKGAVDNWGKSNSLENSRRIDKAISPAPEKATLLPYEQREYRGVPPQAIIGALFNREPELRAQAINFAASPTNLLPAAGKLAGTVATAAKTPAYIASASSKIQEAIAAGAAAIGTKFGSLPGGFMGYVGGKALAKIVASPAVVKVGLEAGAIPLHVVEKILGHAPKAITPMVVDKVYKGLNTDEGRAMLEAAMQGGK
jgi:hypothetical protein